MAEKSSSDEVKEKLLEKLAQLDEQDHHDEFLEQVQRATDDREEIMSILQNQLSLNEEQAKHWAALFEENKGSREAMNEQLGLLLATLNESAADSRELRKDVGSMKEQLAALKAKTDAELSGGHGGHHHVSGGESPEEAAEEAAEEAREHTAAARHGAMSSVGAAIAETVATDGAAGPAAAMSAISSIHSAKRAAQDQRIAERRAKREQERAAIKKEMEDTVGVGKAAVFVLMLLVLFYGLVTFSILWLGLSLFVLIAWIGSSKRLQKEFGSTYGALFFVGFLIHAFMFKAGFFFSTTLIALVAVGYIIMLFVYWAFAKNAGETVKGAMLAFVFAIIVYALPVWQGEFGGSEQIHNLSIFVASVFPIWPLYMLMRIRGEWEDGYAQGIFLMYKILLVTLTAGYLLYFGLFASAQLPQVNLGGVDAGDGLSGFFSDFWEKVTKSWNRVPGLINQSLNPGAYYTGQVEQNTKQPLGVKIEDLRPIDDVVDNRSEVLVYGNVYAKSFIEGEDSIDVQPSCVIERKDAPAAVVDPPILDVVLGLSNSFQCTFPPLKKGTYTVKGYATFPFQTWAYISYTFIDDERARNLARQGLDVRQELDIDQNPLAIYTSGPVTLGMGGTPQPIRVSADAEHPLPDGTRIGITLDPGWESGRLDYVRRLELKVPEPFYLYECDREVTSQEQDAFEPLYTSYVFENTNPDVVTTYTSVTCKMGVTDPSAAQLLVSEADKVVRSFIGVAYYTYTVQSQTTVRVK